MRSVKFPHKTQIDKRDEYVLVNSNQTYAQMGICSTYIYARTCNSNGIHKCIVLIPMVHYRLTQSIVCDSAVAIEIN